MSALTDEIRMTLHMLAVRTGQRCEWCGKPIQRMEPSSMHHRRPRGAGGTLREDVHSLAVLVLVHGHGTLGCHRDMEVSRDDAKARGFLITHHLTREPIDPASVPLVLASGRRVGLHPTMPLYLPPPDGILWAV